MNKTFVKETKEVNSFSRSLKEIKVTKRTPKKESVKVTAEFLLYLNSAQCFIAYREMIRSETFICTDHSVPKNTI